MLLAFVKTKTKSTQKCNNETRCCSTKVHNSKQEMATEFCLMHAVTVAQFDSKHR